jgi:hypothetical protein
MAVIEQAAGSVWRAFVDGTPIGPPIALPRSHARFRPLALVESWDGGRRGCNRFRYRFEDLQAASPAGTWSPVVSAYRIVDRGHRLRDERSGFVASAGR